MRIRSDDRIILRHVFLHEILVGCQTVIIFQPDLGGILQQETETCRSQKACSPYFPAFAFCVLRDLCKSHGIPQHDKAHARERITAHKTVIDRSGDHASHDTRQGKCAKRDGRCNVMILPHPVHGSVTDYQT